jgi:hypothetical protein
MLKCIEVMVSSFTHNHNSRPKLRRGRLSVFHVREIMTQGSKRVWGRLYNLIPCTAIPFP